MTEIIDSEEGISIRSELQDALDSLESETRRLRLFGFQATTATMCNLLSLAISILFLQQYSTFLLASMIAMLVAILSLIMHEQAKSRGNVLFEEISDELEWYLKVKKTPLTFDSEKEMNTSESQVSERPRLQYRIVLRRFVHAEHLPFTPFSSGVTVYFLVNVALLGLAILLNGGFKI